MHIGTRCWRLLGFLQLPWNQEQVICWILLGPSQDKSVRCPLSPSRDWNRTASCHVKCFYTIATALLDCPWSGQINLCRWLWHMMLSNVIHIKSKVFFISSYFFGWCTPQNPSKIINNPSNNPSNNHPTIHQNHQNHQDAPKSNQNPSKIHQNHLRSTKIHLKSTRIHQCLTFSQHFLIIFLAFQGLSSVPCGPRLVAFLREHRAAGRQAVLLVGVMS